MAALDGKTRRRGRRFLDGIYHPDRELCQPAWPTIEAGDIAGNILVYYEADPPVTSVAALVVKGVATCVVCKTIFHFPSCFTKSDDVKMYPGYLDRLQNTMTLSQHYKNTLRVVSY